MKAISLLTLVILSAFILSCSKSSTDSNTTPGLPDIAAASASNFSNIASTTASYNATINSDGGSAITAKGVCWSTAANPTISDSKTTNRHSSNQTANGTGSTSFTAAITGLTPNTTYYLRVYATNSSGTAYSNQVSFTTLTMAAYCGSTVTDIDGNVYNVVTIGTQCWLQQDLRVTRYRNGDSIPIITGNNSWWYIATGAECYYDNNPAVIPIVGRLYNWSAVNDSRGIAPVGWHVASNDEWLTLQNYLGGDMIAGGPLKETGTAHWISPNNGATNSTGFTALPGGFRYNNGPYSQGGYAAEWWTSTETSSTEAQNWFIYNNTATINHTPVQKQDGFSVRCVKD